MSEFFYATDFGATIELRLRRTLLRSATVLSN
jgi:hypothetical protein